jgi:hypothetical protein
MINISLPFIDISRALTPLFGTGEEKLTSFWGNWEKQRSKASFRKTSKE